MFAAIRQSAVGRQPPVPTLPTIESSNGGNSTPEAKQSSGRSSSSRPPVDEIDTAKKASRSSLSSPDDTISPLPGDASTVPSSSPPTDNGRPIAQNLRDMISMENIPAPPFLSAPTRPLKGRANMNMPSQTATGSTKPPTIAGRTSGRSKKKKSKKFTLPFLLGYEQMVRVQDNADASTITHLRPVFDRLRYIGGDSDTKPASMGMADGNDSTTSLLGGDDRSTGTSGTLDTYGTSDRSDAERESDALSYLTSLSNRIDMDDGTLLTFAAIVQSLDVLTRKEDEMICDNNLMLMLQSISDAVLSASASADDEIDEEFEYDGLTFAEFLHAYQNVVISIRAMRRFPAEGEDRKARTRDRAQQLLLFFVPKEIVLKDEDMADVELNENHFEAELEEKRDVMGANVVAQSAVRDDDQAAVAELEQTIAKLKAEKEETGNEAKKQQAEMKKYLNSRIQSLEVEKGELEKQMDEIKASLKGAQHKREVSMEDQKQLHENVSTMKAKIQTLEELICDISNEKKISLAKAQQDLEQTRATLKKKQILLNQIKAKDESYVGRVRSNSKMAVVLCGAIALSAAAAGAVSAAMWNKMATTSIETPAMRAENITTHSNEAEEYPTGITVDEAIPCPASQICPRSIQHFALRKKIRQMEIEHSQWKQEAQEAKVRTQFHELMSTPTVSTSETIQIPGSKISKRFSNRFGIIRSHIVSVLGGATAMGLASNIFTEGGSLLAGASVICSPFVLATLVIGITVFTFVGPFDGSDENQ